MATTRGADDITVHQENDDLNNDDMDNTTGDIVVPTGTGTSGTGDGTSAATGTGGSTASMTNFNLRDEQNKIPEFFGTKSRDTISAMDFIRQLEDLAKTSWWTDAQMYYYFANSLRNPAQKWLSSMVDMDDDEQDRYLWSDFKDLYKQKHAVQTNERLILEGLSNLTMKPTETTNEVISRITRTVRVIKESFKDCGGLIPYPPNDRNDGISNHAFRTFMRWHNAMMFNFFKMNLFKAALTPELRAVVTQQDLETMMYQVMTTAQREGKGKAPASVNEVSSEMEDDKNDIVAFNGWGAQPKMS